jgi:hypothetical protein
MLERVTARIGRRGQIRYLISQPSSMPAITGTGLGAKAYPLAPWWRASPGHETCRSSQQMALRTLRQRAARARGRQVWSGVVVRVLDCCTRTTERCEHARRCLLAPAIAASPAKRSISLRARHVTSGYAASLERWRVERAGDALGLHCTRQRAWTGVYRKRVASVD